MMGSLSPDSFLAKHTKPVPEVDAVTQSTLQHKFQSGTGQPAANWMPNK